MNINYEKVERYARKALEIDPKLLKAWQILALLEESRGNSAKAEEDFAMAMRSAPDDPSWAFDHALSLRFTDPERCRELLLEVVRRFPASERASQALYFVGVLSQKQDDRIRYLEQLRNLFPPAKFGSSESGMDFLFGLYTRTNTGKALALAKEMAKQFPSGPDSKTWQAFAAYAQNAYRCG